jgi:caa(3)-type oxidase subunit IV
MADLHSTEGHHGPTFKTYWVIFAALSILTAVSFIANTMVRYEKLSATNSFLIIMAVAIIKAVLVAMYFMHLVVDWGRLYYFIIPALLLGTLAIVVLLPDIVLAWRHMWGT